MPLDAADGAAYAPNAKPGAMPANYRMSERASHADFGIRDQDTALPNPAPHRHEYFQIHAQLEGATQHFLGGVNRPVRPGTLCFILPYKTHFIPTVAGSRYYILNASQKYLLPSLDVDMLDLEDVPVERAPELAPFLYQEQMDFVLDEANAATARLLCEAIMKEDQRRAIGSTIMIRGYLLQLIALVWQQHEPVLAELASQRRSGAAGRRIMTRLLAYLRENIDGPVSLTDAAAAVHLSPTYLARLVRRETGQTFIELLNERRIALAKELLMHTELSIKEIAFRAGFSDLVYFGRRFRKIEGCSPTQARARLRLRL
ncbi:MAG TPA: AraC family transcriptional regulator [Burkholderiaceae bacterium]|nr:AraC family transcriptional regulator [Burkholderiaceae bacterium]